MKDFKNLETNSLDSNEMMNTFGGADWKDVLWMFAEEIIDGYTAACITAQEWLENNPDYTAGRSFNH